LHGFKSNTRIDISRHTRVAHTRKLIYGDEVMTTATWKQKCSCRRMNTQG
jgi:hypothetical protein